jgi:hypothetical protein
MNERGGWIRRLGLHDYLRAEQDHGRRPLFILGSGISASKVPVLKDIGSWLSVKLAGASASDSERPYLDCAAANARLLARNQASRRDVAELFHLLQTERAPFAEIWEEFAEAFVLKGLTAEGKTFDGVQRAEPTEAHRSLAEGLVHFGGYVISLNFDRLTHSALRKIRSDAVVLHTKEEVDHYFGATNASWTQAGNQAATVPTVFKVRGDVFYARCTQQQCPQAHVDQPLALLTLAEPDPLRCSVCGEGRLRLQFSFPGYRLKEEAAYPMLWTIRRYIAAQTSAIVVVGFSGRWDRYLLDFILDFSRERDVPVLDVNIKSPEAEERLIRAVCQISHPSIKISDPSAGLGFLSRGTSLVCINSTADVALAAFFPTSTTDSQISALPAPEGCVPPPELTDPRYFADHAPTHITIAGLRDDIVIPPPEAAAEIRVREGIREHLSEVSQLGLKDVWIGQEPDRHNRWHHSRGAYNLGHMWLHALEQSGAVPPSAFPWLGSNPEDRWAWTRLLVGHALILHDLGHLLFSHLTEGVLQMLHWVPPGDGLELTVLAERLKDKHDDGLKTTITWLDRELCVRRGRGAGSAEGTRDALSELIGGTYGVPWMQAIVNSPVDADKGDYIYWDGWFLRTAGISVGARGDLEPPGKGWLEEFLQDQEVNHAGLLCLHGRSARAAAELWQDRLYMYDRFYLAPETRVPDRLAAEIVERFLIRATMDDAFRCQHPDIQLVDGFRQRVQSASGAGPAESKRDTAAKAKRDTVIDLFRRMGEQLSDQHAPEKVDVEWAVLTLMRDCLKGSALIDGEYGAFLEQCYSTLESLRHGRGKGIDAWRRTVETWLVREPLVFHARHYRRASDLIRPLQHRFCREALLDLVRLPRVLAPGRRFNTSFAGAPSGLDYQILVPDGRVSSWAPGSRARRPLTDECVEELELAKCRVIVMAADAHYSPRAAYVWDRVRSALLEAGIELERSESTRGV